MIKGSVEICRSKSPKICPNFLQPCGNQCCLEVKDWKGEIHLRWQKSLWGKAEMLLTFQVSNCYSTFNLWSPFFVFYCIFVTIFRTLPPSPPCPPPFGHIPMSLIALWSMHYLHAFFWWNLSLKVVLHWFINENNLLFHRMVLLAFSI